MKLFTVQIGRRSRHGNFEEFTSRAISVSDDKIDRSTVHNYFQGRYDGLEIIVTEAKEITDITKTISTLPTSKYAGVLSDFFIEHTDEEKKIFAEYKLLIDRADDEIRKLHRSIKDRYNKISYVRMGIDLFTDYRGTACKSLPINSRDFFRVVKAGMESMEGKGKEEVKTEEDVTFELDDPLPDKISPPSVDTLIVEAPPLSDDEFPDIPF
jgi:hypothetical protein